MIVYGYDDNGFYQGEIVAQPSPLEAGKYLIPRNATTEKPLDLEENKENKWDGSKWVLVDSRAYLEERRVEREEKLAEKNSWGVKLYEADGDWYKARKQTDIDKDIEEKKFERLFELIQKKNAYKAIKMGSFSSKHKLKAQAKITEIDKKIGEIDGQAPASE